MRPYFSEFAKCLCLISLDWWTGYLSVAASVWRN